MAAISVRRRARERALQFLFGLDFTHYAWEETLEDFWKDNPAKPGVKRYARELVRGVCQHHEELDEQIIEALDNWSPERVGHVERVALRIALYEMRYRDDVPPSVAINEAIEVVKRFGTDDAPRFVNGVLDRLRRTIADSGPE